LNKGNFTMNEILLLQGNPSKRRKGSRKRRSAAQRAATKRMLAANRARSGAPKRRKSRRKASAAPIARRARRAVHRVARRARRHGYLGTGFGSAMGVLKTGAIMGGGAVVADVGMGFVVKLLAGSMPSLTTPVNADGSTNYGYLALKGGLIYAMGKYGSRVTRHAPTMAAGAAAVMLYQVLRGLLPQDGSIPLGYFNPGKIVTGGNLGRIMKDTSNSRNSVIGASMQMGRIMALPNGSNQGAIASATIRNLSGLARR
jgi:hypothetical protein